MPLNALQPFQNRFQSKVYQIGSVLSVLLVFGVPFSTAVSSILPFIILFFWIIAGEFLNISNLFKNISTAAFAFILFLLLAIAVSYSSESLSTALNILKKYRELLLIIILLPFFNDPKYRQWAFHAFTLASIITLFSSYLMYFEWLPAPESARGSPSIRMRITHSLFIAFFAFYCAHQYLHKTRYQYLWAILFLGSTINIFFLIEGRTGQLIYFILIFLFSFQRLNLSKAVFFLSLNLLFLILFLNFSAGGSRIHEGIANSQSYLQGQTETKSSIGQRLTFWKHSVSLIIEKPLLGHGTGSFEAGYKRLAAKNEILTSNPHSEFLMITIQTGVLGLIVFIALLASFYKDSLLLATNDRYFAQGVLLTLICNSVINSTLLDNTEGHWFAALIALSLAPLVNRHQNNSD